MTEEKPRDVKISLPNFTAISNKKAITFGFVEEGGKTYAAVFLDARIDGGDVQCIILRDEDSFARLWNCIEIEFSDIQINPAHWG